jgi:hypothetical protein
MRNRIERVVTAGLRSVLFRGGALGFMLALALVSAAQPAAANVDRQTANDRVALPQVPMITVRARIRVYSNPLYPRDSLLAQREVTFTPSLINVGTVRMIVTNSDDEAHWFQINGVTSKRLLKGGRAVLVVKFKKPGIYRVSVTSETPVAFSGQLKVIK